MPLSFYLTPLSLMPRRLHSDTIAAAIMWSLAEMGKEEELEDLIRDASLRVSSAFPFVAAEGRRVLFAPKPLIPPPGGEKLEDSTKKKRYKEATYVEVSIFNRLIKGDLTVEKLFEGIGKVYEVREEFIVEGGSIADYAIKTVEVERNRVNRLSGRADDFFLSRGAFYQRGGIYFVVKGSGAWLSAARQALQFLQDRGIGGEISIGYGHFSLAEVKEEDIFDPPREPEASVLLSLYYPKQEEWASIRSSKERLFYSLVRRAGRRRKGLRKGVWLLGEGSVIPLREVEGDHVHTACNPPSVEWGHPLCVGMRWR